MSERAITDPTEHGWVDAGDGKWMWGGSGGGSGNGSIQDGDTEGQITTWSGTEWTPEGAVVVDSSGNVGIGTDNPKSALEIAGSYVSVTNGDVFGYLQGLSESFQIGTAVSSTIKELTLATDGATRLIIDGDGNVDVVDGELRVSSSTDSAYIRFTNSVGEYEIRNSSYGSLVIDHEGVEKFVLASTGDVYLTGRLFLAGGEEVTGGGGLWTDNGDGTISSAKTAKAPDFVTT